MTDTKRPHRNFYGRLKGKTLKQSQKAYLDEDLAVAARSGMDRHVLSRTPAAIKACRARLTEAGIPAVVTGARRAFHGPMMAAAAAALREQITTIPRNYPKIPIINKQNDN